MSERRILIVDDEPEILELLQEILVARGYAVDAAVDATQALERVRERMYDAAILDFNLPDMDGVMLHREIRRMDDQLAARTLFISGLVQTDDSLGYYSSVGGGFLSKPFDVQKLVAALQALWDGKG